MDETPRSHHGVKQIFFNTFAGLASSGGSALVGLIATPLLIERLGVEVFGFWVVLTAMVNYAGLIDGGLNATFMKYVAEYAERKEIARIRQVITFGSLFYLLLGAAAMVPAYYAAPFMIRWMHVGPALAAKGPTIFAAIVFSLFLTSGAGAVASVLSGFGYLRTVWTSSFASRTAYAIAAVVLCSLGFGLDGMIAATFIQLAVFSAITFVAARRLVGHLFIAPWLWERHVIVKLFKLGAWIQVTNVCTTIAVESNRFIVSAFVSTSAVTYFEVGSRLTRTVRSLPFNFIVALLPAVSAKNASSDDRYFNDTFVRASRYVNYSTLLLVGFIMAAGTPLSYVWIGTAYPGIGAVAALVGLSFVLINMTMVGTTMVRAVGLARYESYYYMVWTAAGVILMLALVPKWGMTGILWGMVGGAAAGTLYFLRLLYRLRGIPVWSGFFAWALPLFGVSACAIGSTAALAGVLAPRFPTRAESIVEIAILAALYFSVFIAGTVAVRFFTTDDWSLLHRLLPQRIAKRIMMHRAHAA